ncbi:MAG: ABC transporter ATP-binding protein/permease [Oscillospiraceae bacterium]|jgi:ABC-type bacteriocin/lantibiotic exporter with double-glycine peptidase domain|nr:ABC transporter ATP-binding protein/permease [Oscillospiraceae bacterium]
MQQILRHFFDAIRAYPRRFGIALFFILCVTGMNAGMPWVLRKYLDILTVQNNYTALALGILFFIVFLLTRAGLHTLWFTSLDAFAGSYMEAMVLKLEARMAGADYSEIEKIPGGMIRNILYTDVLNMFRVVGVFLPQIGSALLIVVATLLMALFYDGKMALLILVAVLLGMLLSWCSRKALAKTAGTTNAALKVHDAWCSQFVDVLPLAINNDILGYYQARTSQNIRSFIKAAKKEDRAIYLWLGLTNSYHALFGILISALLAIPLAGNSLVNLVFFTMLANVVMQNAQTIETTFQAMMKNLPSFGHIERLNALPAVFGSQELDGIARIDFENVSFAYASGVQALQSIQCSIKTGDCLVLQGQNGSGKSTFVKLLAGMYLPTAGHVKINGRDIASYDRQALNRQILYINQDEKCLNETFRVYLNTLSGQTIDDTTFDQLLQFVELPDDGRCIEGNGASLSVGQRKKLYLMKLLARIDRASVLILDELMAGMDQATTKKTHALLRELFSAKNKVVILIEHHLPDDLPAHQTYAFEEGRLAKR